MKELLSLADDQLLTTLWDAALKTTLLVVLAGAAASAARRASAATRHLILCASLAGALLLPVLSLLLPEWRVPWMPQWLAARSLLANADPQPIEPAASEPPAAALSEMSESVISIEPQGENTRVPKSISVPPKTMEDEVAAQSQPVARSKLESGRTINPARIAAVIWCAGLVLSLAPLAIGTFLLARLTGRSARCELVAWNNQAAQISQQLGLRRAPSLRIGDRVRSPLTWGAWHPVLLLPTAAQKWSAERRRVVLWHELAHVKRFDWLTQTLAYIACSIYWFNPLAWWAARRMRVEREAACDDVVLAAGSRPADYADELLKLASAIMQRRLVDWAAVPMARRSTLEGRLLAILDGTRSRGALTRALLVVTIAILAAVAVPIAMMRAGSGIAAADVTELKRGEAIDLTTGKVVSLSQAIQKGIPYVSIEDIRRIKSSTASAAEKILGGSGQEFVVQLRASGVDLAPGAADVDFSTEQGRSRIPDIAPRASDNYIIPVGGSESRRIGFQTPNGTRGLLEVLEVADNSLQFNCRTIGGGGTPSKRFGAMLPNGTWVEILGVGGHPSADSIWRRADGTPLARRPYLNQEAVLRGVTDRHHPVEIAVRIVPPPGAEDVAVMRTLEPNLGNGSVAPLDEFGNKLSDIFADVYSISFDANVEGKANVTVGVAIGPWKTAALRTPIGDAADARSQDAAAPQVAIMQPVEVDGHVVLDVIESTDRNEFATRFVVVDNTGKVHNPESDVSDTPDRTKRVWKYRLPKELPVAQVREFRYEYRPFDKVVFQSVAVSPYQTEVTIKTSAGDSGAVKSDPPEGARDVAAESEKGPPLAKNAEDNKQPQREFVRVVVDLGALTFEGQSSTWDKLPELLAAVPERGRTVLELAIANDEYNMRQLAELQTRGAMLAKQHGFEYLSFIGVQPLGSKGTASGPPAPPEIPVVAVSPPLRQRIEELTKGAAFTTKIDELEFYEPVPGMAGEFRVRPDVVQRSIVTTMGGGTFNGGSGSGFGTTVPIGHIYHIKDKNRFYIQSDGIGASTLHFYGPFDGDPLVVLGIPGTEQQAGATGQISDFKDLNIIWGQPNAKGVRAGIAVDPSNRKVKLGNSVLCRVFLQNISQADQQVSTPKLLFRPQYFTMIIRDDTNNEIRLQANPQWKNENIEWSKRTLTPNAVTELRIPPIGIGPGTFGHNVQTILAGAPGHSFKVQVRLEDWVYSTPTVIGKATSGDVTISIDSDDPIVEKSENPPAAQTAPSLRERIEKLLQGATAVADYHNLEIFEREPNTMGYHIRADVTTIVAADPNQPLMPRGPIYYLKDKNRFYIEWEFVAGSSTRHFYGPFEGDPATVLGLPAPERPSGAGDAAKSADDVEGVRAFTKKWLDLAIGKNEKLANSLAYADGKFVGDVYLHPDLDRFEIGELYAYPRAALVASKPFTDANGQERIFLLNLEPAGRGNAPPWRIHGGAVADLPQANELIAAFTAPPVVDKVVERTLHLPQNESIDLDSNKTYQMAADWEKMVGDPFKWIGEHGIDLQVAQNPNSPDQLLGVGGLIVAKLIDNDQWERGDKQSVAAAVTELDISSAILRVDNQKLPATYAIRTMPLPNGNSHYGLLQLASFDANNQNVTIRYRLFADENRPASSAAISVPNDGQPSRGVSAELSLVAPVVRVDNLSTAAPLMLAVHNRGDLALSVAQSQQLGELEVDGKWYTWAGDLRVRSSDFPPGREYRDIPIMFSSDWHAKEGGAPLNVAPGRHTVRFAVLATSNKYVGPGEPQPIRAVSNAVELVLDGKPRRVSGVVTAWGARSNGLALGFTIDGLKDRYQPGDILQRGLRLRNDRREAVTIVDYIPLRGWYPRLIDSNGNDVSIPMPEISGQVFPRELRIEQGQEVDLGRLRSIRAPDVPVGDLSFKIPDVPADAYRIQQEYHFRIGDEEISLATGQIAINVGEKGKVPAESDLRATGKEPPFSLDDIPEFRGLRTGMTKDELDAYVKEKKLVGQLVTLEGTQRYYIFRPDGEQTTTVLLDGRSTKFVRESRDVSGVRVFAAAWGKEDHGLQFGAVAEGGRPEFRLGDRATLALYLRATGEKVQVESSTYGYAPMPKLFDASGKEIPLPEENATRNIHPAAYPTMVDRAGFPTRLADGVSFKIPDVPPGDYTVRQSVRIAIGNNRVEFTSGDVPIKIAPQPPWSEAVGGVQVFAAVEKKSWPADETPKFSLDLKNAGKEAIHYLGLPAAECRLKIDGEWYGWSAPLAIGMPVRGLELGQIAPNAVTVSFAGTWAKPVVLNQWRPGLENDWGEKLSLKPGKHAIQIQFRPMHPPHAGENEGALSNLVEFKIEPPVEVVGSQPHSAVLSAYNAANDAVLRAELGRVDLAVVGKVDSKPGWASDKINVGAFYCDFKVADVIRGGDFAGKTIRVCIFRKTPLTGPPPKLQRGDEIVLFLKKIDNDPNRNWATPGYEVGSYKSSPDLVAQLKRLAAAINKD